MNGRARALIAIAQRRARRGSGTHSTALRARPWSKAMKLFDLSPIRAPYLVVGGLATARYMRERQTDDVDLLTLPEHLAALTDALRAAGCALVGSLAIGGESWVTPAGVPIDVLVSGEPWAREAFGVPEAAPDGTPVIGLPWLVLMKARASRAVDVGDLSRMLGAADEATLARVLAVVARHDPESVEDVEALAALGRLEYADTPETPDA
jgi:hypothetical protein